MFFILNILTENKIIEYSGEIVCPFCGRRTHASVMMFCMVFSFFFIPLFRFNRRYFVRFDCCNNNCELNPILGRELEKKHEILIKPEDLDINSSYKTCESSCYNENAGNYYSEGPAAAAAAGRDSAKKQIAAKASAGSAASEDTPFEGEEYPVYCGSCGGRVRREDEICPHCGAKL